MKRKAIKKPKKKHPILILEMSSQYLYSKLFFHTIFCISLNWTVDTTHYVVVLANFLKSQNSKSTFEKNLTSTIGYISICQTQVKKKQFAMTDPELVIVKEESVDPWWLPLWFLTILFISIVYVVLVLFLVLLALVITRKFIILILH